MIIFGTEYTILPTCENEQDYLNFGYGWMVVAYIAYKALPQKHISENFIYAGMLYTGNVFLSKIFRDACP